MPAQNYEKNAELNHHSALFLLGRFKLAAPPNSYGSTAPSESIPHRSSRADRWASFQSSPEKMSVIKYFWALGPNPLNGLQKTLIIAMTKKNLIIIRLPPPWSVQTNGSNDKMLPKGVFCFYLFICSCVFKSRWLSGRDLVVDCQGNIDGHK